MCEIRQELRELGIFPESSLPFGFQPNCESTGAGGKATCKKKSLWTGQKSLSLGALCSLTFWGFINTSPFSLQHHRNLPFGECRGSLNLLLFRRNFSSFTQEK